MLLILVHLRLSTDRSMTNAGIDISIGLTAHFICKFVIKFTDYWDLFLALLQFS